MQYRDEYDELCHVLRNEVIRCCQYRKAIAKGVLELPEIGRKQRIVLSTILSEMKESHVAIQKALDEFYTATHKLDVQVE